MVGVDFVGRGVKVASLTLVCFCKDLAHMAMDVCLAHVAAQVFLDTMIAVDFVGRIVEVTSLVGVNLELVGHVALGMRLMAVCFCKDLAEVSMDVCLAHVTAQVLLLVCFCQGLWHVAMDVLLILLTAQLLLQWFNAMMVHMLGISVWVGSHDLGHGPQNSESHLKHGLGQALPTLRACCVCFA